jgi:hypothetical protein
MGMDADRQIATTSKNLNEAINTILEFIYHILQRYSPQFMLSYTLSVNQKTVAVKGSHW